MSRSLERLSWERIGAAAGLVFVAVVLVTFFLPDPPDADLSTAQIMRDLIADRDGLLLNVYLGGLASAIFVAFTAGLWSRLRAAERAGGPSVLVILGGLGSAVVILIANAIVLAMVDAADEVREPVAVRALYELDQSILFALGFTSAVFYSGAAISALRTRALPVWLAWSALVLATLFVVSLLGVFSEDEEGGALGALFFLALLLNFIWVLAASVVLLAPEHQRAAVPRGATEGADPAGPPRTTEERPSPPGGREPPAGP